MAMAPVVPLLEDTGDPFSQLLATEHTAQTVQAWIQEKKDAIRAIKRQAIDQDTPFDVIYEGVKRLEGEIGGFKQLLQSNEATRAHWRREHMAAWRPSVRSLKVTHLPNEILTAIFANLQDDATERPRVKGVALDDPLPSPDVASIQSVRLTCRAFCDWGSRFLLPIVNIAFTAASIQRLQEISGHADISKGVRVLRLHANPYSASRANDETAGVLFCQEVVSRINPLTRVLAAYTTGLTNESKAGYWVMLHPEWNEAIPRVVGLFQAGLLHGEICSVILKMIHTHPLCPSENEIKDSIEQAHREYRRRYLEQQSIMRDNNMSIKITTAVRHMPSVQTLCIPSLGWDHTFRGGWDNRYDMEKLKYDKTGVDFLLDCMGHDDGKESSMRSRLGETDRQRVVPLLHKLPSLLRAASGNLTSLDIDLPIFREEDMDNLVDRIPDIQCSCRDLKYVRITVADVPEEFGQAQTPSATFTILDAILGSPRLEAVSIYCSRRDVRHHPVDNATSIGPVLGRLPWDNLRSVCLRDITVKLGELQNFMGRVSGKIHLDLEGTYLMGGTWDEALEILRGKVDQSSRVVDPRGDQLENMTEREVRDLTCEFDSEHRDGWYSFQRCPGPASFYIRGGNIANPLISGSD